MDPVCRLCKKQNKKRKEPDFGNQVPEESSPHLQLGAKTNDWVQKKVNFFVGPQESLLAAVKRRKIAWFGHVTRNGSLSETIFQGTWRVGDAVVGRENAGWATSKSGHPSPYLNCSQGPPAEKTGRRSLLNRPSYPPDDIIGQGTELNYTHEHTYLPDVFAVHFAASLT